MFTDEDVLEYELELLEAWEEVFAQPMYYVQLEREKSNIHPIYAESKKKVYDFENKILFHGKFLQEPYRERGEIYGRENYDKAEISFVSKELRDKGVLHVEQSAVIEIFDSDGNRKLYNIIGDYGKVQLRNRKLITRLIVSEVTERERTNLEEDLPPVEGNPKEESPKTEGLIYL